MGKKSVTIHYKIWSFHKIYAFVHVCLCLTYVDVNIDHMTFLQRLYIYTLRPNSLVSTLHVTIMKHENQKNGSFLSKVQVRPEV